MTRPDSPVPLYALPARAKVAPGLHDRELSRVSDGVVHVVAAALVRDSGEVLLTQRPRHKHQGGLWEFPGGKLEPGEAARAALDRELAEELGIRPRRARPLIRVQHDYTDRTVLLEVWRIDSWEGEPVGLEGQPCCWVLPEAMDASTFPPADLPIINALRLPSRYLITGRWHSEIDFTKRLERALQGGIRLVQLRSHQLPDALYEKLAETALSLCHRYGARLLVNTSPARALQLGACGVHLTAGALMACSQRPLGPSHWVGASCHDARQLVHAQSIGADFAVLGPVRTTTSHPEATPLGWEAFATLTDQVAIPVYALGGLAPNDIACAWDHGGQGIGAITSLWDATAETTGP